MSFETEDAYYNEARRAGWFCIREEFSVFVELVIIPNRSSHFLDPIHCFPLAPTRVHKDPESDTGKRQQQNGSAQAITKTASFMLRFFRWVAHDYSSEVTRPQLTKSRL